MVAALTFEALLVLDHTVVPNLSALLGYKPVLSEMFGLLLGGGLCILELQALKTLGQTPDLRRGLIATFCGDCDTEDNVLVCRKYETFRRVKLLKNFCLVVPVLIIGVLIGQGMLIYGFLALVPNVLTVSMRKNLLARITSEMEASREDATAAVRRLYQILSRNMIVLNACEFVITCALIVFIFR